MHRGAVTGIATHLQAQKVTSCAKTRGGVVGVSAGLSTGGDGGRVEGPALVLWQRDKPLSHRKLGAAGTALEAFHGFIEPAASTFGFGAVHTGRANGPPLGSMTTSGSTDRSFVRAGARR